MNEKQTLNVNNDEYKKADDLTDELGIAGSTIRKYASDLEKAGYRFRKGARNARFFNEKDQFVMYKMIKLIKETGMSTEKAAEYVMNGQAQEGTATDLTSDVAVQSQEVQNNDLAPLLEKTLNELFHLKKHIVDNTVSKEQFDDLAKLTRQVLNETVEIKREQKEKDDEIAILKEQLVTTQQQYAYTQEKFDRVLNMIEREEREGSQKKKGFLSRFFGS